jgi:hypothetical protein
LVENQRGGGQGDEGLVRGGVTTSLNPTTTTTTTMTTTTTTTTSEWVDDGARRAYEIY